MPLLQPMDNNNQSFDQLNEVMKMMNQFLLQGSLEQQRMGGYKELEGQRHGNRMKEIEESFYNTIAQDPTIQRKQSEIFTKKRKGEDTSELEAEVKDVVRKVATLAYKAYNNKPTTEEDWVGGLGEITDETARRLITEGGQSSRQGEMIEQVYKPEQATRQLTAETGAEQLKTRQAELGLDRQKFAREGVTKGKEERDAQIKVWRERVKDIQAFLAREGVEMSESAMSAMRAQAGASFLEDAAASLRGDPLSAENRGKLFIALGKIRTKIDKGIFPSDAETNLIEMARSTYQIEEEGGGFAEAGGTLDTRANVDLMAIEQKTREIMEIYKLDEESARKYAMEYLGLSTPLRERIK